MNAGHRRSRPDHVGARGVGIDAFGDPREHQLGFDALRAHRIDDVDRRPGHAEGCDLVGLVGVEGDRFVEREDVGVGRRRGDDGADRGHVGDLDRPWLASGLDDTGAVIEGCDSHEMPSKLV